VTFGRHSAHDQLGAGAPDSICGAEKDAVPGSRHAAAIVSVLGVTLRSNWSHATSVPPSGPTATAGPSTLS
jgi:hypothetical protein